MADLNEFTKWQAEKPDSRHVKIDIEKDRFNAWVYDYEILTGQHVQSVAEINLEAAKEEQERGTYERLKKKFEIKEESANA